jgi:hypothetical protein
MHPILLDLIIITTSVEMKSAAPISIYNVHIWNKVSLPILPLLHFDNIGSGSKTGRSIGTLSI